ncbi:uncharacterized protein LOC100378032 [Saccoglossus kowalevskii]|uniref:Uncharacterized protein LOC100378032 n=1 Tax=Saccoglossus kowalevskii TaxID=10224 RepID=A0ABM0GVB2_SACKO|nr:PREDICTED: uncharacterized protein LOC100378032 [Saccoglossus kowalevskii]
MAHKTIEYVGILILIVVMAAEVYTDTMDFTLNHAEANMFLKPPSHNAKRWVLERDCEASMETFEPPPEPPVPPIVEPPNPCDNVTHVIPDKPSFECRLIRYNLCMDAKELMMHVVVKLVHVIDAIHDKLLYVLYFIGLVLDWLPTVNLDTCLSDLACAGSWLLRYILWDLCLGPTLDFILALC